MSVEISSDIDQQPQGKSRVLVIESYRIVEKLSYWEKAICLPIHKLCTPSLIK